jgi:hypothetical protein
MAELDADFLLGNPDLVQAVAPWCTTLDNLEIAIIVLAQPWMTDNGLRRAELEHQLDRLATDLPVGPTYFQRINRTTKSLEERGILSTTGSGRARRFAVTAEGFAALILNLRSLHADPTIDGSEFELKRAIVATWNQVHRRMLELPAELTQSPEIDAFFAQVEQLSIWGRPVISEQLIREAFDILGLIALQRARIHSLRAAALRQAGDARARTELVQGADLSQGMRDAEHPLADSPETLEMVRALATTSVPELQARARMARYDAYLHYLDHLTELHAGALATVDITRLRALARQGSGRP